MIVGTNDERKVCTNMAVRKEIKRAAVTLSPEQRDQLKKLSEKYRISQSKILARGFDMLVEQEKAHFDVGLKK